MSYQEVTLDASGTFQASESGKLFLLESISGAGLATVDIRRGGKRVFRGLKRQRGLRIFSERGFDLVRLEAPAGTVIGYTIADEDIRLEVADGMTVAIPAGVVVTNTALNRVPVDVGGAVINVTATAVEIDQKAVTVAGYAYTVPAAGIAVSTAAAPGRRAIHFRNADASVDCYLAAFAAAAKTDCPILLRAGECLLIDDRSAAAAWVAFSDGADINLVTQEVTE